jgi:uncharacterized protein
MMRKRKETLSEGASIKSIAIDTGAIIATLSSADKFHRQFVSFWNALTKTSLEFVTTEACLTEVNYLLPNQAESRKMLRLFLEEVAAKIIPLDLFWLPRLNELMDKYADLPMDFADATLVLACENLNIRHILTTDTKDFCLYRPRHCKRFEVLPHPC